MGALVTLRDVESLERIGSQLQVSERLAALGRVTAGVAHEVKNPLNSMRLWLEVLKANMPVEPEPQQAVKMLDSEIDRLDRAVKTFPEFHQAASKCQAGRNRSARAARTKCWMRRARRFTRAEVELRAWICHRGISARAGGSPADASGSAESPVECFANSRHRVASIDLGLRRNGEFAEIAVADTGKGISPEDQKKIFQLFFTTRAGGTGIGLANTFRFVQIHNGQIEFDSELGRGTTFRLELPLARSLEAAAGKYVISVNRLQKKTITVGSD